MRVLPPCLMQLAFIFTHIARPIDIGLIPRCFSKYLSSNWMIHCLAGMGKVSSSGNRHCSSVAMRAPSNWPFTSSNIVLVGWLNVGVGRINLENMYRARMVHRVVLTHGLFDLNSTDFLKMRITCSFVVLFFLVKTI